MSNTKTDNRQSSSPRWLVKQPTSAADGRSTQETTLTIAELRVSPLNARRNHQDANATEAIEASILAEGLIHAINVHPMRGSKLWGAFAGGRRYRSIKNLVDRGDLPADWPVKVKMYTGYSDVEIYEMSLSENISRRDLRMYEVVAGMRYLHTEGRSVAQIAKVYGQEEIVVLRWLRIGQLAKPIFDAWAEERIAEDQAKAFAATEDQDLQLQAFAQFNQWPAHLRTSQKIHEALRVDDHKQAQLLRFVGPDAYRAANGRFELDLFAEIDVVRGRVADPDILLKLVDEGLDKTRKELRARTGRPDLRFTPAAPVYDGATDYTLMIRPIDGPDDTIVLPDGDIVAELKVGDDGAPSVHWWWASRRAKFGTPKPASAKVSAASSAEDQARPAQSIQDSAATLKEDEGLSLNAIQVLRAMRRAILRAAFVQDARDKGSIALDYFVFAQIRMLFNGDTPIRTGMRAISVETSLSPENARDIVEPLPAGKLWHDGVKQLSDAPWRCQADLRAAFAAYRAEPRSVKDLAAAIVAGFALERSMNFDGYRAPMHDVVGAELGLADDRRVRRYWEPTEKILMLFGRRQLLDLAEPLVNPPKWGEFVKLKATDLAKRLSYVFTQETQWTRYEASAAARTWVHPLLQFGTPAPADAETEA